MKLPDGRDELAGSQSQISFGGARSFLRAGQGQSGLFEGGERLGVHDIELVVILYFFDENPQDGEAIGHALCHGHGDVVVDAVVVHQMQLCIIAETRRQPLSADVHTLETYLDLPKAVNAML